MVLDDYAKANVFNKYFASIGNIDRGPVPNFPSLVNNEKCMRDVTVTESDVLRAICKMKANASSGPGLPPVLFKKLKHSLTTPRTLIYNQLLSVAEVPADRKKAFVVPVFKKGSTASVVNYRPISLTGVLSKILERILVAKIIDHLHANGLVSPEQHGFLKGRSTCTNLLSSQNDWTLNVELGFQTAVACTSILPKLLILSLIKDCLLNCMPVVYAEHFVMALKLLLRPYTSD